LHPLAPLPFAAGPCSGRAESAATPDETVNGLPVAAHDSPRKALKLHQRFEHRKFLAKRRALLLERALDLLERNRVNEVMSSRSPATTSALFRASAWAEALLGFRLSARTGIPRRRRLRRDLMGFTHARRRM